MVSVDITSMSPFDIGVLLVNSRGKRRLKILNSLDNSLLKKVLETLDPDDITDVMRVLSPRKKRKIISLLEKDIRDKVNFLLSFKPSIAAGLMNLNYIQVKRSSKFGDVIKLLEKHESKTGKVPEILVVDSRGRLVGELPIHLLALHKRNERIDKFVKRVHSLRWDTPKKEVIRAFKKHPHKKFVIVDNEKVILGVIYSDDILQVLHEEATKSLYHLASVSEEEDALDSFIDKVKHRYGWLIINLFTEFLAASVISLFEGSIRALVLLAVYMPVVAGMGGNAATQTLAVIVRGFALNEIDRNTSTGILFNEIIAGVLNGVINGSLVALVAIIINRSPLIGVAVFLAMIINMATAAVFGTIVPIIMQRIGKDPASSATIFITTATDLVGFFSFLGIATLLM
jgi:magnesium transporter